MVGTAVPASAGLNNGTCEYFEFCLWDWDGGTGGYREFYWGTSHTNLNWYGGPGYVRNDADSAMNRDSECTVRVIDDRGWWPDDWQDIPNNGTLYDLISSVDNENDRHERRC